MCDGRPARPAVTDGARPGQGPELRAGGARSRVARPVAVSAGGDAQGRGARAGRVGRAGGRAQARLAGSVLSRGDAPGSLSGASRRAGGASGEDRRPRRAMCSASTRARTCSPSVSATALGIGGGEPLYVLATDTHANTVTVGPRAELLCARRAGAGGDAAPRRRLRGWREGALARATAVLPAGRRGGRGAPRARERGAGRAGGAHGAGPVRVPVRR